MNVIGWQKFFRRTRSDARSPFAGIVTRVRYVRENCAWQVQSRSDIVEQRASRVAAARKRIVYCPPDYEKKAWPKPPALRPRSLWAMAIVTIGLLLAIVLFSSGLVPLHKGGRRECEANLKALEGAMWHWAFQNGKTTNDTPTDAELFGPARYMDVKPRCPAGGEYIIGNVGAPPRCTIPEHRIQR